MQANNDNKNTNIEICNAFGCCEIASEEVTLIDENLGEIKLYFCSECIKKFQDLDVEYQEYQETYNK